MDELKITETKIDESGIKVHSVAPGTYFLKDTLVVATDERFEGRDIVIVSTADPAVSVPGGWRNPPPISGFAVVRGS